MKRTVLLVCLVMPPALARADEPTPLVRRAIVVGPGAPLPGLPLEPMGPPKRGAPYSARSVGEHVQLLADGNRIRHVQEGTVARDGEGRTRREHAGPALDLASGPTGGRVVVIDDPTVHTTTILDPGRKTAVRLPPPPPPRAEGPEDVLLGRPPLPPPGLPGLGRPLEVGAERLPEPRRESLPARTIEGLRCEGTRLTVSVPAGHIGNERAFDIVTTRWFSPELGVTVESRHEDPRFGTATFKLVDVRRTAPDAALFVVPSDFQTTDGPPPGMFLRHRRIEKRLPATP